MEISYELFGAPNFGENLGELKGLESAGIGADFASAKGLESWQIQRYAALMRGREINPEAGGVDARDIPRRRGKPAPGPGLHVVPREIRAARGSMRLWKVPWKLTFDADCDALIFLNGKFVGRYVTIGPQKEFYLPEPYLSPAARTT